ncbi:MAG: DUF1761 domain-containing protein [Alphaproteobacteria bacterium]|nr:DUF1761 domain-containing protein [Alphaproteobacteria bacterium]
MGSIDWIAVLVATVSAFVLGGLWYSPLLFAKAWMAGAKLTEAEVSGNMGAVFGQAIVAALVTAMAFGWFVGNGMSVRDGVTVGAITGLGLVTASLALNYAFERRPLSLLLINGGYYIVQFVLYGLIFALI